MIIPTETYGLGRLLVPDYRDGLHLMSMALDSQEEMPDEKEWDLGEILDQGQRPMCVAYAIEQFLNSAPSRDPNPPTVDEIYAGAQAVDNIPGKHDGTTVRAGLTVLSALGNIDTSYVWAYDTNTLKRFLLTRGPVVFGVTWYEQMFHPTTQGLAQIGGNAVGGHSFLCSGYSQSTSLFHFVNSWGTNWGANGTFYMSVSDVSLLLRDFGEAGSAVDIKTIKTV